MEEDVAAAAPTSRAAFLLASQKKGDVFTLAHLLRRTPEEIAAGGVASSLPTTFGGLICPWAEERHSGPPPGPADVLQARPRLPRSRLQFSFILVRRTETLLVDLALEALKGNLGV